MVGDDVRKSTDQMRSGRGDVVGQTCYNLAALYPATGMRSNALRIVVAQKLRATI